MSSSSSYSQSSSSSSPNEFHEENSYLQQQQEEESIHLPQSYSSSSPLGLIQTENGYDTLHGTDAICWETTSSYPTTILRSCPNGNSVRATMMVSSSSDNDNDDKVEGDRLRLRTGTWHHYKAEISLNLTSFGWGLTQQQQQQQEANNHYQIGASVIACRVGLSGGLCTPFLAAQQQQHQQVQATAAFWGDGSTATTSTTTTEEDTAATAPAPPPVLQSDKFVRELWHQKDNDPIYQWEMEIPMLVESPGDYFVIVALEIELLLGGYGRRQLQQQQPQQFSTAINTAPAEVRRIDMANSVQPIPLVTYQEPALILSVSKSVRIAGYVVIGLTSITILWLLYQTIQYLHHASIRMAQGRFLVLWLVAGLSAVICSLLLEPRNDTYCRLGLPFVVTSLQLFFAISVGRVWRINSVISPAILQAMEYKQPWWIQKLFFDSLRRCTSCLLQWENSNRPKRLRKAFSEKELVMVVVTLTVPQIILQALGAIYQPWQLALDMNDDESIGRQYCALPEDLPYGASIFYHGIYVFILLILMLFIMARAARNLPSLFNESRIIFDSLLSSLFLLVLGLGVIFGTRSPTTSPSISYIVCLVMIIFVVLQSTLRLLIPKLKMAWRNEVIMVSDVMSEHAQQVRDKQARRSQIDASISDSTIHNRVRVTGLNDPILQDCVNNSNPRINMGPTTRRRNYSTSSYSLEESERSSSTHDKPQQQQHQPQQLQQQQREKNTTVTASELTRSESFTLSSSDPAPPTPPPASGVRFSLTDEQIQRQQNRRSSSRGNLRSSVTAATIHGTEHIPSMQVVVKALDLETHLANIKKRILMGLQVGAKDWNKARELADEMEMLFEENDLEQQEGRGEEDEEERHCRRRRKEKRTTTENGKLKDEATNGDRGGGEHQSLGSQSDHKFLHQQPGNVLLEPETVLNLLGDGPMRFANPRRSVHMQVASLPDDDQESYRLLRSDWREEEKENCQGNARNGNSTAVFLSGEMILRFLRHCNEDDDAKKKQLATWRAMKRFDTRYLTLTARSLEEQLLTKTLFPIPGVKTLRGGNPMFYMRPCRYNPYEMRTSLIIDNLVYCMQTMLEDEAACTNGIGFVACMDDWTMKHFSPDYCFQFMQALQGNTTPVCVTHFLIVNPPAWFGKIWAIMKTMLSVEFQEKVHMIPECQLSDYLAPGYEQLLPDDMVTGEAPTDEMVNDWLAYRKFIEGDGEPTEESCSRNVDERKGSSSLSTPDLSVPSLPTERYLDEPKSTSSAAGVDVSKPSPTTEVYSDEPEATSVAATPDTSKPAPRRERPLRIKSVDNSDRIPTAQRRQGRRLSDFGVVGR